MHSFFKFLFLLLFFFDIPLQAEYRGTLQGVLGKGWKEPGIQYFETDYIVPQLHKWYGPRNLVDAYVRPWYTTETNYAREYYQRYVNSLLEGAEWFDSFGTPLGRGWLVYSWSQTQEAPRGSEILKRPRNPNQTSAYRRFFDRLVIATDGIGANAYRLLIGDSIYTSFTPLTFYKPRFNGMRLDYDAERYRGTMVLSRPSEPNRGSFTDVTHIMGGHVQIDVASNASLGLTYVNGHNARTEERFVSGNPLQGILSSNQNQALKTLWVQIRDDSPTDLSKGAVLFAQDIVMSDTSGQALRGSEIGFFPFVEGGVTQGNNIVASGSDIILLRYDLEDLEYNGISSVDLKRVQVELSLANDYQVEMTSNLQTDGEGRREAPVFLPVRRAQGNIKDLSNGTIIALDYSLPTANELIGVNWNTIDWHGLTVQGELVLNRRFGQYPSPNISRGYVKREQALAAYTTALYDKFPWAFFLETFSMDDDFSTNYWVKQANGKIRYRSPVPQLYEFVDDDDDHNALPDWERPFQAWNPVVWPGYDENQDFLYDHNQNGNLQPDYEEPFLRFRSDRPEYLFGLDLNHNDTIDRFENDALPDYPYKRDHQGFNAYVRANIGPDIAFTLGHQRMRLLAGDGRTKAAYFLGTWIRSVGTGRFRLFEHALLVKDNIPDDLTLWIQPIGALGRLREVPDPLSARNSWKNILYADLEQGIGPGIRLLHRFKWKTVRQRQNREQIQEREGRMDSGFLGVINKVEWSIPIGLAVLEPRWKSEFRRERPFNLRVPVKTVLEETVTLLLSQPLLAEQIGVNYFPRFGRQKFSTELQVGWEMGWIKYLDGMGETQQLWTLVTQVTNRVAYIGYDLVTRAGLRWGRQPTESGQIQSTSLFFLSVNAGL